MIILGIREFANKKFDLLSDIKAITFIQLLVPQWINNLREMGDGLYCSWLGSNRSLLRDLMRNNRYFAPD